MSDYKSVPSGMEIRRRIADCLERMALAGYQPSERAQAIHSINDILQGRARRTAEDLLTQLEQFGDDQTAAVRQDIRDFLVQRKLLTQAYTKCSNGKRYVYHQYTCSDGRSLKIIDQKLYDRAARHGFPPNFFRESYFDQVTFYCLPDSADFYCSELHHCKFAVCRLNSISFVGARIYASEIYSSILNHVDFFGAFLAYTHFHDSELSHIMLQSAQMKSCNTIDCTMCGVNYSGATLDGCSFGRIIASTIRNLDQATITQGGATEEECRRNRDAVYEALGVKQVAA